MPITQFMKDECFFGMEINPNTGTRYIHIFRNENGLKNWECNDPYKQKMQRVDALWLLVDAEERRGSTVIIDRPTIVRGFVGDLGAYNPFIFNLDHYLKDSKNLFIDLLKERANNNASNFEKAFIQAISHAVELQGKSETLIISFNKDHNSSASIWNSSGTFCFYKGGFIEYLSFMRDAFDLMSRSLYHCTKTKENAGELLSKFITDQLDLIKYMILNKDSDNIRSIVVESLFKVNVLDFLIEQSKFNKYDSRSLDLVEKWMDLFKSINPYSSKTLKFISDDFLKTSEFMLSSIGEDSEYLNNILIEANQNLIKVYTKHKIKLEESDLKLFHKASVKLLSLWSEASVESFVKTAINDVIFEKSLNSLNSEELKISDLSDNNRKKVNRIRL